eukprot:2441565-Heterocapsa_arctica.AAC.1
MGRAPIGSGCHAAGELFPVRERPHQRRHWTQGRGIPGKRKTPPSGSQTRKQVGNPEDWQCECGYDVWAKS